MFPGSGMEMALMNSRDAPLHAPQSWGGVASAAPRFWLTGAAFILIYLALNVLTEWHEFDRLGITLWSPDDGLSLALLTESIAFAPFVFLGAVLVDLLIAQRPSRHRRDADGGAFPDDRLCRVRLDFKEYYKVQYQTVQTA